MIARCIDYFHKRPSLLKKIFYACLGCIACSGILARPPEAHVIAERLPLFWSLFGLAGCAGLALVCKWLARRFLERATDYYDA